MIFKKIRKGHADWRNFLCSTPARDYVFQKDAYEDQIDRAAENIRSADCVIIGAGAGASTAAGIQYGGKRFTDNFAEFIKKYGGHYMTDMYAAGFYPYPSEEAKWGYWSKHALMNRFDPPALPLYTELYDIVKNKEYFVLTTNVDHQFYKAGFDEKRIFATQGDYGKIQCQKACHPKTYDAKDLFRKMDKARRDCLIPSELVPKCPVCGGNMAMNLRCDNYFVEDEAWHEAADRYAGFLEQNIDKKVVLYTGTLRKIFGVMNLVEAFKMVKDRDVELWICGSGDSKEAINEATRIDSRIKFFGLVDSETALEMQHKATILVNPRTSEGEYTKYSFPSKTMEYLLAGRSVIINHLSGIPEEYYDYVYTPKDESVEALAECISSVIHLDMKEREERAKKGRQFIIEKKNSKVQMERVIKMIESYANI